MDVDSLWNIMIRIDRETLKNLCESPNQDDSIFGQICSRESFWKQRFEYLNPNFDPADVIYELSYRDMLDFHDRIVKITLPFRTFAVLRDEEGTFEGYALVDVEYNDEMKSNFNRILDWHMRSHFIEYSSFLGQDEDTNLVEREIEIMWYTPTDFDAQTVTLYVVFRDEVPPVELFEKMIEEIDENIHEFVWEGLNSDYIRWSPDGPNHEGDNLIFQLNDIQVERPYANINV